MDNFEYKTFYSCAQKLSILITKIFNLSTKIVNLEYKNCQSCTQIFNLTKKLLISCEKIVNDINKNF